MKAERIIALVGTGLTGVICLGLSVICAATAISATSLGTTLWFGLLALLETGAVVNTAYQITKAIKEWF